MDSTRASDFISSIRDHEIDRYTRYLTSITPVTEVGMFRRWLFAFASVHTTWQMNCKLYNALNEDFDWIGDPAKLKRRIQGSRCGLHNNRTRFIHEFTEWYWEHPDWYRKDDYESWVEYRDRIKAKVLGLGQAKSSFGIELIYPLTCEVLCTDVHVLRFYSTDIEAFDQGKISEREEREIEQHWVQSCQVKGVSPAIARWVFWDRNQNFPDPSYWSCVFERKDYHDIFKKRTIMQW